MTRPPRSFMQHLAVVLIVLVGFVTAMGEDSPTDLIALAETAYATRHIEESMIEAISLLEAILPVLDTLPVQSQTYVLNLLSQLCYEVTTFTEGDTPEDGEWFERGKAYGLRSLRLDPVFVEAETRSFGEAVSVATDTAALHWTASNWGKIGGMNPIQGLLYQGKILDLFSRTVEVDPEYWGASASASLGSLLIMSPSAMGGDKETGLALVEDSIALAPTYLSNHLILAEYWGFTYGYFGQLTGIRDAELIEREVAFVLESDTEDWPFWNLEAKRLAAVLLDRLHDMMD
ncbi:TRAP transporter TatT component family protein [Candidatus Bipolaricaulota bacterium]